MRNYRNKYPANMSRQSLGQLQIEANTRMGYKPIPNAKITIKSDDDEIIEILQTDISGKTGIIELPAPPIELSLEPSEERPFSTYNVEFLAEGYEEIIIEGTQIFPEQTAIQGIQPNTEELSRQDVQVIFIDYPTLYGDFPPKIPEDPIKPPRMTESGLVVLPEVVVPQTVIVHDGVPDDSTAPNYFVSYKNYIKNVASSEIYSTWPEASITANVLAILSFTLNRVYTEWYRGKGFNFTITSSTAYDHKFTYGRNIFSNISRIVDNIFINYVSIPGIKQPLLTQYCDGVQVQCPEWMTQWGSKYLADQGFDAISILRYYYGQEIFINTATRVSGIPSSFPGTNLQLDSRGQAVRTIQQQLNAISNNFPAIPKVRVDGVFGSSTETSVKKFQEVFNLPPNGIVDYPTWYKISDIYVAVERLAELR